MEDISSLFLKKISEKVGIKPEKEIELFKEIEKLKKEISSEPSQEKKFMIEKKIAVLKKKIVEGYYRLLINLSQKYKTPRAPQSDLISEGTIAIMDAVDFFDYTKDVKFISYIYPIIKQRMLGMVFSYQAPIKVSKKKVQILNYFNEIQSRNYMLKGNQLPFQTVTKQMGIDSHKVSEIIRKNYSYVSIDKTTDEDKAPIENFLPAENKYNDNTEEKINLIKKYILEIKEILSKDEFLVLDNYYGLSEEAINLNEIAKILNISSEGVRQIHLRAIKKIKGSSIFNKLEKINFEE